MCEKGGGNPIGHKVTGTVTAASRLIARSPPGKMSNIHADIETLSSGRADEGLLAFGTIGAELQAVQKQTGHNGAPSAIVSPGQ
jgi:hypothetical protein